MRAERRRNPSKWQHLDSERSGKGCGDISVGPIGPEVLEADSAAEASQAVGESFEQDAPASGEKSIAGRTPWQLARARIRRDKVTMIALIIILLTLLMALLSPILDKLGLIDPLTNHTSLVQGFGSTPTGGFGGVTRHHWLGVVPQSGTDVLSRLVSGITLSLIIATSATVISMVLGTVAGIVSGYLGGFADSSISRFIDLVLAFPQLLMLIALSNVIEDRLTAIGVPAGNPTRAVYLILVLGFFGWPYFGRIIRGQVLSLREREFVEAARSIGASKWRIYYHELLPNLWAPILIYFTLNLPVNISAEAYLSFLGIGIQAPTSTLGNVLSDSVQFFSADPTYTFIPALTIFVIVLSFNLLGDGLRDALDPKSNR